MTAMNTDLALAIKNVNELRSALHNTLIYDLEAYASIVSRFENAVKKLAEFHRNWNPVLGEPDNMIDYTMDDFLPTGWRIEAVDHENLTVIEELTEEILYHTRTAKLANPSIGTLCNLELAFDAISTLATYHPNYNESNGEIDSELQ